MILSLRWAYAANMRVSVVFAGRQGRKSAWLDERFDFVSCLFARCSNRESTRTTTTARLPLVLVLMLLLLLHCRKYQANVCDERATYWYNPEGWG